MNETKTAGAAPTVAELSTGRVEKVTRNPAGQLVVTLKGQTEPVVEAVVARCFPWSLPDTFISIRDKQGKEIVLLETLDDLEPENREVIRRELADRVFNPRILRILKHTREFGVTSITAETDRGTVTFQIRTRDDIRMLSLTRLIFRDADGTNYEVTDRSHLDTASQRCLEEYF